MAQPASADWYEASSDHFVIYADDSEKDVRRFAENLERYHRAMAYILQRENTKPSPSNRVTIFVVGSQRDIRRLSGSDSRTLAGFYVPRAGGSRAFVQDIRNQRGYPHFSTVVLLHEYAHHFLISSNRYAMPRWMSEGAAEFFASASFNSDGSVLIGRPAQHRAGELAFAVDVGIRELLDPELYEESKGRRYDSFYARSWLLYHYLTFTPERAGQIDAYWLEVLNGSAPLEAGEKVFGDLDQLQRELDNYARSRRMYTFNLSGDKLSAGEISIRELPEGEAEMMEVRMRSQRGVNREQAAELVVEAREIAAKYPDDPGVLSVLAEAEYDAGNDAEAIVAADRAIAIDPARTNPYVQKGYALFRMASDEDDPEAAYERAMEPFEALNARENDHPLPLIYYYRSYAERGMEPPENARAALEHAAQLAPFDQQLWLQVALMQAREGKIELARMSLQPLAANPHGGRAANAASALIELLGKANEGEPLVLQVDPGTTSDEEEGSGDDAEA
ncbi:MAG: hypothetical protein ACX930_05455 [Erythrobacter sp.]